MGSQQTRELIHDDLSDLEGSASSNTFSRDVCLIIFSFLNSPQDCQNLVLCYSKVCRQWRFLIRYHCGIHGTFCGYLDGKQRRLKPLISNGSLKYFYMSSIRIHNGYLKGTEISHICNGNFANKLIELNVNSTQINDQSLSIIVDSLSSLEILRAQGNNIKNKGLMTLSQSENMKHLKILDIYSNPFTVEGVFAICSSPYVKNLVEINFGYSVIGKEGIHVIVSTFKLKRLEIYGGCIGNEGMITISNSPNMVNLELLNVQKNEITTEGAKSLANSEYVKQLTKLDISRNSIGNDGGCELLSSHILTNVNTLKLGSCKIGEDSIQCLTNNSHCKNLTSLSLMYNSIGSKGAGYLATSEILSNLTRLDLHANNPPIGDEGIQLIGNSLHLRKLINLKVGQNQIGNIGLRVFTTGNLLLLKKLDLSNNEFSDMGWSLLDDCIYLKETQVDRSGCRHLATFSQFH